MADLLNRKQTVVLVIATEYILIVSVLICSIMTLQTDNYF